METQKDLKDTDGFDLLESTELAIDKRKFLCNRLFVKQPIPQMKTRPTVFLFYFKAISGYNLVLRITNIC